MDFETPVIYGLEFQARALSAVHGESQTIDFLVGTQTLKHDNQVHLLSYNDEDNSLDSCVFDFHPGEIWQLSACPAVRELCALAYSEASGDGSYRRTAGVYTLPTAQNDTRASTSSEHSDLSPVCDLRSEQGERGLVWHPTSEKNIATFSDKTVRLWDLAEAGSSVTATWDTTKVEELTGSRQSITQLRWNPHQNCSTLVCAFGEDVLGWDRRQPGVSFSIKKVHDTAVRDADFNPNKQYYLATAGDDCCIRFWDIRSPDTPLLQMGGHTHWVWSVRYNHSHDQLVLSASSDNLVVLHNAGSISSDLYGPADDETPTPTEFEKSSKQEDGQIAVFDEHEDSVYAVEWAADPWLFASVSYDGRFVINHVPKESKYSILL
eukprot:m.102159 g.102159  ORF g.102159 m.102159 type:complete len:378 (-) comp18759_c0_seq1:37-1170(-)